MAYEQPTSPPAGPPVGGQPYYAASPAPKKKPNWGCIVAIVLSVLLLGGVICAGGIYFFVRKGLDTVGGMQGAMAMGWLSNVMNGDLDAAGSLTEGGRPQAEAFAQDIEKAVGEIRSVGGATGLELETVIDESSGEAVVTIPVTGTDGSATLRITVVKSPNTMFSATVKGCTSMKCW